MDELGKVGHTIIAKTPAHTSTIPGDEFHGSRGTLEQRDWKIEEILTPRIGKSRLSRKGLQGRLGDENREQQERWWWEGMGEE